MRKLLLPVDGSECSNRAVQYVVGLGRHGVKLDVRLMNVQVPIESQYLRRFVTQQMVDTYHQQEADAALKSAKALLAAAEIPYQLVVEVGHAGESIARYAAKHGCDGIVMGTRGMGAVGNLVLGSVASHVIHLSNVPVTLIK